MTYHHPFYSKELMSFLSTGNYVFDKLFIYCFVDSEYAKSQNDFINKVIDFYIGYLRSEKIPIILYQYYHRS